jgi:cytochrome c556
MRYLILCLSISLSGSLFAPAALADAEADIKYRQNTFKIVGGHMGSMATILRDGIKREDFAYHARSIAAVASLVPTVFPAGSGDGKTEALPEIWTEPEEFQAALDKFLTAAANMGEVADSDDMRAIGGAMKALGGSCKGCHDNYKAD